jgi:hypothetical protein
MTTNDGKPFERLVKLIEGFLIPQGFTIESRERIYTETGIQIAEFDIVITGTRDGALTKWLIECRDRPSEGPAPTSWIEQLVGRRQIHNFSKVMAVSTTGFSEGAKELAKLTGIGIRSMDSLTIESVLGWLPINAPLVMHYGEFDKVQFHLRNATDQELADLNQQLKVDTKASIIVDASSNETISIMQLWQRILNKNAQLFNGLSPNEEPKYLTVQAVCTEGQYQITIGGRTFWIAQIDFSAKLSVSIPRMPLTQVRQYSETNGEQIARVAKWEGQPTDPIKELIFVGFPKAK